MSPAAAPSSVTNWRSVAWSAASGMLLTRPIVTQFGSASSNSTARLSRPSTTPRSGLEGSRSRQTGMTVLLVPVAVVLVRGQVAEVIRPRRPQGLVQVGDDVVGVLDADAEPDHRGGHTGVALLLLRHLPVRGGGRVAGQRLGIPQVD